MNLSDTSIDSSVQSGILDDGENDIANNLQVNLSVTSSLQSDLIQDARSVGDLVAENKRLVQENDALKQRVAELQAADAGGAGGAGGAAGGGGGGAGAGGGGAGEVPAAAAAHSKPWSQCSREWKRRKTEGIASEIDRVAENHQTTAITVAAHMLRRKARVASETDIWIMAQKMPLLVASWLCVRSNRTAPWAPHWSPSPGAPECLASISPSTQPFLFPHSQLLSSAMQSWSCCLQSLGWSARQARAAVLTCFPQKLALQRTVIQSYEFYNVALQDGVFV